MSQLHAPQESQAEPGRSAEVQDPAPAEGLPPTEMEKAGASPDLPQEGPQSELPQDRTASTVEAILFATEKPLSPARISEIGQIGGVRQTRRAIEELNRRYERMGCAFRVVHIAEGYQMQTLPEYGEVLARLATSREESRLSQAALEALAIVAYRQPVLRADVEAIRGVACGDLLRGLMEKNLVRITGRADEIGRPLLYGTTRHFLEVFGLSSLEDLPNAEQLRPPAGQGGASSGPAQAAGPPAASSPPGQPAAAPAVQEGQVPDSPAGPPEGGASPSP